MVGASRFIATGYVIDGVVFKVEKKAIDAVAIDAVPESIVGANTCENFKRQEFNVQLFFYASRAEVNPLTQSMRTPTPSN